MIHICERCGMPDVREVVRVTDIEDQVVEYVDLRCPDCGWADFDYEGGT